VRNVKALRLTPWLVALAIGVLVLAVAAVQAATGPAIQTSTPNSADDITNVDVLKQQIRNYYGDPLGTGNFAADSNYAKEAASVAGDGSKWLAKEAKPSHSKKLDGAPAIVLDVDDTTLATYNYEIFSNWAFNPTTNGNFVNGELFPAVPGMVQMAQEAASEGYAIFFLTGRPTSQAPATIGNLVTDASPPPAIHNGYPTPTALFTKPPVASYPAYLQAACAGDPNGACTTTHYKTATRKHIEEDLGYDIVANFGDQFSDLNGGFADETFKMPNPSYFLP
jgi:predicted secreted acid phosphatase